MPIRYVNENGSSGSVLFDVTCRVFVVVVKVVVDKIVVVLKAATVVVVVEVVGSGVDVVVMANNQ